MSSENIEQEIGFSDMKDRLFEDNNLEGKTKRLIALGSAVAINCDECVDHQKNLARKAGFTDDEINEAIAVAALIRFGSGLRHID
ncbi:alkylhydroperoxidase [Methanococcoides methylutens]|uniref:Alkylhydroperoxidase n=1 Tax=Methanococcoides methylutens TaxID=2226 RepID=A0A099T682_METMT|nr:carboxymuconolactone decarboxylase family protein [Methanococcoides methylutens]KGK99726.1 alkylhydroperoxidase [Methanococcoides methylutens]